MKARHWRERSLGYRRSGPISQMPLVRLSVTTMSSAR